MGTKAEELGSLTREDVLKAIELSPGDQLDVDILMQRIEAAGIFMCKPTGGCLGKALPDEPLFILRGHDMTSPSHVRQWARGYYMLNTLPYDIGTKTKPDLRLRVNADVQKKHDEAMRLADAMEKWHDRRVPGW